MLTRRRDFLRGAALGVACALPGGCTVSRHWPDVAMPPAGARPVATIRLVSHGWHTELALPVPGIAGSQLGAALLPHFPGARWLLFGFGLRRYFTNPDPGSGDLLAGLAPGPAAIRVSGFVRAPPEVFEPEDVVTLPVTAQGLERLLGFLWAKLEKDPRGVPLMLPQRQDARSLFFAAASPYDLGYTCNTWTALALRLAGLPVDPTGVVFADQAMSRARAAATTVAAGDAAAGPAT